MRATAEGSRGFLLFLNEKRMIQTKHFYLLHTKISVLIISFTTGMSILPLSVSLNGVPHGVRGGSLSHTRLFYVLRIWIQFYNHSLLGTDLMTNCTVLAEGMEN